MLTLEFHVSLQDYVVMDKDLSLEDLAKFMNAVWKLRVPGIVLSVISNSDYFDSGTDSDVEDFQIGLIQVCFSIYFLWFKSGMF